MGKKNKVYSALNYERCREVGEKAHRQSLARLGAGISATRLTPVGDTSRLARMAARVALKER